MKKRGRTNFANRNLCAAFLVDLTRDRTGDLTDAQPYALAMW